MPLGVNARTGWGLDGPTVAGQDVREEIVAGMLTGASPSGSTGIAARPGVRPGIGTPLKVSASSGMNISVAAGTAFVQGSASATAGMYTCCLDTAATLTVATSDPTNPRIDNVICQITDNGDATSTTKVTLQTGTPAPSPVAPTLPSNSLLLATVSVAANTSTIVAGNITDKRVYTVASGGIVPMDTSGGITGQLGHFAFDTTTQRLRVSDGSGNAMPPHIGSGSSPVGSGTSVTTTIPSGTPTTIVTQAANNDIWSHYEIFAKWTWITWTVAGPLTLSLNRGATVLDSIVLYPPATGVQCCGGTFKYYDYNSPAGSTSYTLVGSHSTGANVTIGGQVQIWWRTALI